MKRIIALALFAVMLAASFPMGAFADGPFIIHDVNVRNVVEPVSGDHPVFHAETDSISCLIDENSEEEGLINGVYWIEQTKNGDFVRRMTESDTFREGYDYLFGAAVITADFARFANYYTDDLYASVNGSTGYIWTYEKYITVTCVFHCDAVIDTIDLAVVRPMVGNTPTFARFDTARYESRNDDPKPQNQANGVTWTNGGTGVNLSVNNPFRENTTYTYKVSLYPKEGYTFASGLTAYINYLEASVKVEGDHVVVSIDMTPAYKNPFTDVPSDAWYANSALYCCYKGYMTGTSDTVFDPAIPFTRAMFVTVLSRIDGADTDSYKGSSFYDVPIDSWFSKPIQWAYEMNYASGLGDGLFGASDPVTREQLARFLYNYTLKKGYLSADPDSMEQYPDAESVSDYAKTAMAWAVGNGLISGIPDGDAVYLSPKGTATRAQVAVIVKNYVENIVNGLPV